MGFPPLRDLLKSKDVEDPVNLCVNRPLAYLLAKAVFPTPLTPNHITLLAAVLGLTAAGFWLHGTATSMLVGGVLLWTSAVFDGADGILARGRGVQSQFGRALDGTSDMVVAAATLTAGCVHLWQQHGTLFYPVLAVLTVYPSVVQINLYDFYKESYLAFTRGTSRGEGEDAADLEQRVDALLKEDVRWWKVLIMRDIYLRYVKAQDHLMQRVNPAALHLRHGEVIPSSETSVIYRRWNRGPMRLWAAVSLAPHVYLMSIFAMFNRLDLYVWVRLIGMNVLFVAVLLWQRHATRQTHEAWQSAGVLPLSPIPA